MLHRVAPCLQTTLWISKGVIKGTISYNAINEQPHKDFFVLYKQGIWCFQFFYCVLICCWHDFFPSPFHQSSFSPVYAHRQILHTITSLQLMHSQYIEMIKYTVIALIRGLNLKFFLVHIFWYVAYTDVVVMLNYDMNLRQIKMKRFAANYTRK